MNIANLTKIGTARAAADTSQYRSACPTSATYPDGKRIKRVLRHCAIAFLAVGTTLAVQAEASCFDAKWRRGKPFDYYAAATRVSTGTYRGGLLYLVESVHFTQSVQALRKGSSSRLPGDIAFVLNTIPNHPGGLDAYSRYEKRYLSSKSYRNSKLTSRPGYKADCLFERAVRVYPQHAETFVVWGIHLHRNGRFNDAKEAYEKALTMEPDSVLAHYNLGLTLLETGDLALAREHADAAYAAGYPLQGLRNKLEKAGNN